MGENQDSSKRVGFQSDYEEEWDQPSSKRQKIDSEERTRGRGEGFASGELVHILQKKKEAAEVRFEKFFSFGFHPRR